MKEILSGNEAIARGCYEYGVHFATAYPGTPSTEILENIAKYPEIYKEWCPNEKVAMEVAIGATFEGARSLVAMKHVGINVAADPFMSVSLIGAPGGFIIVSADDPGMHSSQNEQDNRYYAKFAGYPCFEPADSQEAKDFVGKALEISIAYDVPVLMRMTTRVCHGKGVVSLSDRKEFEVKGFERNPKKFITLPAHARALHVKAVERLKKLKDLSEEISINRLEKGSMNIGVITNGIAYQYVKEVLPEANILKLGMSFPLPMNKIRELASQVDQLFVVEELEPFIEDMVRAQGIACEGMKYWSNLGELTPDIVAQGFYDAGILKEKRVFKVKKDVIPRPPIFCPGCPHRGLFYTLKKLNAVVTTDIGCYTLGALPPLAAGDTCVEMGASIGIGVGMAKVRGTGKGIVATIGDSTFLHSGMTGLLNAVNDKSGITVVIADNKITAMTGGQFQPGTGETLSGEEGVKVDFKQICQALGVKHIREIDTYDLEETKNAIKEEMERDELSVIIAKRPCALFPPSIRKVVKQTPFTVDLDKCIGCKTCFKVSCPAIGVSEEKTEKGLNKSKIDPALCTGCSVCAQVCPVNAIVSLK